MLDDENRFTSFFIITYAILKNMVSRKGRLKFVVVETIEKVVGEKKKSSRGFQRKVDI